MRKGLSAKSRMRLGFIFYKDKKMRNIFSHMYDCARVALKFSYFSTVLEGEEGTATVPDSRIESLPCWILKVTCVSFY
jgi:hypothetical protein